MLCSFSRANGASSHGGVRLGAEQNRTETEQNREEEEKKKKRREDFLQKKKKKKKKIKGKWI